MATFLGTNAVIVMRVHCTTDLISDFRMIAQMGPEDSWVAKWQRIGKSKATFRKKKWHVHPAKTQISLDICPV